MKKLYQFTCECCGEPFESPRKSSRFKDRKHAANFNKKVVKVKPRRQKRTGAKYNSRSIYRASGL